MDYSGSALFPKTGSVGLGGPMLLNGRACTWDMIPALCRDPCRPKPLFSRCPLCGLNSFRSAPFPPFAAKRGISLLLPMASADEGAVLCFSSCSLGRSKWPARIQSATCPPCRGSQALLLCSLHLRSSLPKWGDGKWEERLNQVSVCGGGVASICPHTDLLNWVWLQQLQGNNGLFSLAMLKWKAVALHTRSLSGGLWQRESDGGNWQWTVVKQCVLSLW